MSRTNLSIYNNDLYKKEIGAGRFKQLLWYFTNVLFFINPFNPSSAVKCVMLKWFGAKLGVNIIIKPGVNIKYPWRLTLGNHVWIGEKVWIDNLAEVVIGNNVCISQGAMLLTGNHNYKRITFDLIVKGIVLEDGVWLGAQTTICPGVTAHSHSMLTVGSIATKNMEPYAIYSGNPAGPIKQRVIE